MDKYFLPSEISQQISKVDHLPSGNPDVVEALFWNETYNPAPIPPENVLSGLDGNPTQLSKLEDDKVSGYSNQIPVLVSESIRDQSSIDTTAIAIMEIEAFVDQSNTHWDHYIMQPITMLRKFPSFDGITRLQTSNTPAIISMDWYDRILRITEKSVYITAQQYAGTSVPKGSLLVKVSKSATAFQMEAMVNQLNSILANDKFTVVDLRSQVATTQAASSFIMLVFNVGTFEVVVVVGALPLRRLITDSCSCPGWHYTQFFRIASFVYLEYP